MYTQPNITTNQNITNQQFIPTNNMVSGQNIQTITNTNPLEQEFLNISNNMNFGIDNNISDPFDDMMNNMRFPGININPFQMMNNMIQQTNQMTNMARGMPGGMMMNIQGMQGMGNGGTMFSKQFCTKIDMSDGTPKQESYQSQSIKQFGQDGHNISERQEAYKNSQTGQQKAAFSRMLDNRGTKTIRERNIMTGNQSQHNIFSGIQESELESFNKEYGDYREKVHFQDNYKYLNSFGKNDGSKYLLGSNNNHQQNQIIGQLPSATPIITQQIPTQNIPIENIPIENIPIDNIPIDNIPIENISMQGINNNSNITQTIPDDIFNNINTGNNVINHTIPLGTQVNNVQNSSQPTYATVQRIN